MLGDGRRILETRAPDLLQQFFTAENPAGMARQESEQLVFARGEIDPLTGDRDLPGTQVDGNVSVDERVVSIAGALRWRLDGATAQPGSHPRDKFPQRVWLDHVVVGPEFQTDDSVDLLGPARQHDYRYFAGLPQPAQYSEAIHTRHRDVKHYKVDFGRLEKLERGLAVSRLEYPIAESFKAAGKRNPRSFVVLGDE